MISVLVPTRGRPEALQAMADAARHTADAEIEILAYVDEDDPAEYRPSGVWVVRGPRTTLSECWNILASRAAGNILQMAADDIRHRTPGWDSRIQQVFDSCPDRLLFVFTRDGIHDERLGTHGFVSQEWVETVGYFTPDMFPADYADTWLNEVAGRVNRRVYVPDVLIEHLHPIAGKATWDQTHKERLRRRKEADVDRIWRETAYLREADALRLAAAI